MNSVSWKFRVFFDGDCPLCKREIQWLKRLDAKQQIDFVDIASNEFRTARCEKSHDELMAQIHGQLPDGEWVVGADVFRELYSLVGFRWLVAVTRLPGIHAGTNFLYRIFARYRVPLTARFRNSPVGEDECSTGTCHRPPLALNRGKAIKS
ncbi:MAG: DUF393 domain-containing protein [Pirellulaceae bacterium]